MALDRWRPFRTMVERWQPARQLSDLQTEMNRLFDSVFFPSVINETHNGNGA